MRLWDVKARQGHSLHQMCPYQGSFPPQLPAFFLDQFPEAQVVLDPFVGRGTVALEAMLRGKTFYGVDVNPVALALSRVKVDCAQQAEVVAEIDALDLTGTAPSPPDDVEPFFHPKTWQQVYNLRESDLSPTLTALVLGRLHGHSSGFFSTTTFNVISVHGKSLRKLKQKHGTEAEFRDVPTILTKAAQRFIPDLGLVGNGTIQAGDARKLPIEDNSVDMVITSPPFLDVIDYADVNWLRLWFLKGESPPTFIRGSDTYREFLQDCLRELARVVKPTGHIVFEVGPVKQNMALSDLVVEMAEGILQLEQVVKNTFDEAGVPKISRAMQKGKKTTTMSNDCVILKRLDSTVPDLKLVVEQPSNPIMDLFGGDS